MNNSVRLFTAFPLSPELTRLVFSLQNNISKIGLKNLRLIGKYELHVTLHFLGDIDAERIVKLKGLLEDTARVCRPAEFSLKGIGAFPDIQRARGLTLDLDDSRGALGGLYKMFAGPLGAAKFLKPESTYKPHITLARVRGRKGVELKEDILPDVSGMLQSSFKVDRIVLYRSELTPAGARYYPEGSYLLGGQT